MLGEGQLQISQNPIQIWTLPLPCGPRAVDTAPLSYTVSSMRAPSEHPDPEHTQPWCPDST